MVCVAGTVLTISFILVLKPTHDAHVTDWTLKQAFGGGWRVDAETAQSWPISPSFPGEEDATSGQGIDDRVSGDDRIGDTYRTESEDPVAGVRAASVSPHTPLVVRVS